MVEKVVDPSTPLNKCSTDEILWYLYRKGTDELNPQLKNGSINLLRSLTGVRRKPIYGSKRGNQSNRYSDSRQDNDRRNDKFTDRSGGENKFTSRNASDDKFTDRSGGENKFTSMNGHEKSDRGSFELDRRSNKRFDNKQNRQSDRNQRQHHPPVDLYDDN